MILKILFQRSGGHYLFWLSTVYLIVGFTNIAYKFTESEYIQIAWIFALMIPLVFKPVAHWLNMRTLWEK
jgi:hypothetical protein